MEKSKSNIKVAIADDHKIFREGITMALSKKEDIQILWEAKDGKEMINKISRKKPEVLLMDIRMPKIDGINAIQLIRKEYEDIKIIVLTMYDDQQMISKMMEMGANAYLTKTTDPEEIYEAILTCINDDFYFNELVNKAVMSKLVQNKNVRQHYGSKTPENFNEKELKILQLISENKTSEEISKIIFLSPRTISSIVENMKVKVNVKSISSLVEYGYETGMILTEDKALVASLSKKQMLMLFSLSTSILKYINHDLSGMKASVYMTLIKIKEILNQKKTVKPKVLNTNLMNGLIESAITDTLKIGAITNLIKSHYYWPSSVESQDLTEIFMTKPLQIVSAIQLSHKKVKIEIHKATLKSLKIIYPPTIFLSILSELIKNATKAKKSNLNIVIKWRMKGNIFQCEVHDNGPGFSKLKTKKLASFDSSTLNSTGIGLNVINRTVYDSGGHLFFYQSKILAGAMIYFEFPVFNYSYKTL